MKILFLANHLNAGGITSYLYTLSCGLKGRGHNVFIAYSFGGHAPRFIVQGIKLARAPLDTKNELSPKLLLSAAGLAKFIRENKVDIVHSNSRTTQVLGCLLQKLTGVRHVFTCHGFFKRRLSRRLFPCWGDKIISISAQVREHLISDFKVDPALIAMVHNGVDAQRFAPCSAEQKQEARDKLGIKNSFVIGIIARLSDVKGHRYLIEAMRSVLKVYPDTCLLVAGEGKIEKEIKELCLSLKVGANAHFIPKVQDTRDILAALDIFVLPSLNEGLGLALMEAMSMGLSVVGSDVGGIKTLIQDSSNGILVNPGDSEAIARALVSLIADPGRAAVMGAKARKFIQEEFSQDKMVLQTERVYAECLKN